MLVQPHHFDYRRASDNDHSLTADEKAAMLEAGLDSPWAVCGHGYAALHEPPQVCYYCGDKLTIPAVMWYGHYERIWMHPVCAEKLSHRLMRDVRELRKGKAYADQVHQRQKAKERRDAPPS
jgi:hypothetical protein